MEIINNVNVVINNNSILDLLLEDFAEQRRLQEEGYDVYSIIDIQQKQDIQGRKIFNFSATITSTHSNWRFVEQLSNLINTEGVNNFIVKKGISILLEIINPEVTISYEFKNNAFVAHILVFSYEGK